MKDDIEVDLAPEAWAYRDPATIAPRQWLLGTTLLRGYATVLGSMGGVGKTAYAIACALAVITGRDDVTGLQVFKTGSAWLLTLEDDREELERRLAAAMIAHNLRPDELEGRLFVNDAAHRPLLLAKTDENGDLEVCADADLIANGIRANDVALTVIDPLVKSHQAIENSNQHMDGLIGLTNEIARVTRSSILLPCHFRKGGGENGARDAIRGGGALVDGARINRTLVQMSATDADALGIPPEDAFRYIRINDAKANMAPRQAAKWFQLVSIPLGNAGIDPAYPASRLQMCSRHGSGTAY
jgi:RecA-family ATPase